MKSTRALLSLSLLILFASSCSQNIESPDTNDFPANLSIDNNVSKTVSPSIDETIFKVVEEMPMFGECSSKECSDEKLIKYLYSNLKYPDEARKAGIEGRVYVQFVVKEDGFLTDVNIVRGFGGSLDEAALKVVKDINLLKRPFQPGKQRGQAVKVLYTLPISFKLE